jgi:hypothetical protein
MSSECSTTRPSWRSTLIVVTVAFAPLCAFWCYVYCFCPWKFSDCFDPEGIHYACGLSILNGSGPGNVDNPATPLQSLSAILSGISGCGILDLEQFRPIAYIVTLILRIAAACFLVRFVLKDLPLTWQIALLWIPWLAPDMTMMSRLWCPETMYFPLGLMAIAGLYFGLQRSSHWHSAFIAGLSVGVMIGVKFIFVAWAGAALVAIVLSHKPLVAVKSSLALAAGTIAGFVVATLPAWSRYPRMFEWVWGLATRKGQYGSGSSGFLDWELARSNLMEVLHHQKVWSILVVLILGGLVVWRGRRTLTLFCCLAILASYVLAMKSFAPRYLAPTGLVLLLGAIDLVRTQVTQNWRWTGPVALALLGLLLGKELLFDANVHRTFVLERREADLALQDCLDRNGRTETSVILYGWRAFTPAFTVRFMSQGEANAFDSVIDRAFPNEGLINAWQNELRWPADKSDWDFIVVGEEFVDRTGLATLRAQFPSWEAGRYIVVKHVRP